MLSRKSVNPSVARTASGSENGSLSSARGCDTLRWIGLVAAPLTADQDELANRSLTTDRHVDETAHWFA